AFSADGRFLAASFSASATIHLWDLGKGSRTGLGTEHGACALAISPDGKLLVSGGIGPVEIWDLAKRAVRFTLDAHHRPVGWLAFSSDSKLLATAEGEPFSDEGPIRLWDATAGRLLATLEGHTGEVEGLGFSPDAKVLVSASSDEIGRASCREGWW